MAYTTDTRVRYYVDATGTSGFGTNIVGTTDMVEKIAQSDSIVDLKLAKRFNVPFPTTPPAIKSISTIFSAWWSLRSVYSGEIPSALQFVQDDYEKAMQMLEDLRTGIVDLPAGTGTATSGQIIDEKGSDAVYWSPREDYYPIFDLDSSLNWKVNSDLEQNISDSRS